MVYYYGNELAAAYHLFLQFLDQLRLAISQSNKRDLNNQKDVMN